MTITQNSSKNRRHNKWNGNGHGRMSVLLSMELTVDEIEALIKKTEPVLA